MAAEPVDLLVIGGGITGAGVARDAALRGIRTALVDKGDFGGGTSSHSSRLIHGGLRYLEQRAFRLVFEASRERRVLLTIAPHLVRPLAFLFPAYRGARVPAWQLRAGLWLYDLLAAFRNVRAHRWLGRKAVLRVEAGLRERDLLGAGLYYDAQTDDARLVIATIRSAAQAGALVANYTEASSLLKPDGRVRGATLREALTGATCTARAARHTARRLGIGRLARAPDRREPERADHDRGWQTHNIPRDGAGRCGARGRAAARTGRPAPGRRPADRSAPAPGRRNHRPRSAGRLGQSARRAGVDGAAPRPELRQ